MKPESAILFPGTEHVRQLLSQLLAEFAQRNDTEHNRRQR